MDKLTVEDLAVTGRPVLVRVDYNVPIEERNGQMTVTDSTRIQATLPTLRLLIDKGAKIILMAHLGRPNGKREASLSLKPVAEKLSELIGRPVAFAEDCVGEIAEKAVAALNPGELLLLENVRYYNEEEANEPAFTEKLSRLADLYVNDAFGAAHRAHASTAGTPRIIAGRGGKCAAGFLMQRELKFLGQELENPARPFAVILGGAKVSDKIKVIDRLIEKADVILIGGAMAYTFELALGHKIGKSLCEPDKQGVAKEAMEKAKKQGVPFHLPSDHVIGTLVDTKKVNKKGKPVIEFQNPRVVKTQDIPEDAVGLDIGPDTARRYGDILRSAKTILWNGPMGMFEDARFAEGTHAVARAVAEATTKNGAKSIIGGGDSIKALNEAGLGDKVTFMSTGGGAALEFLEGCELPGVAALSTKS